MTTTEQRRLVVLTHLAAGALTNLKAAEVLGLFGRQVQRRNPSTARAGQQLWLMANPVAARLGPGILRWRGAGLSSPTANCAGFNQQDSDPVAWASQAHTLQQLHGRPRRSTLSRPTDISQNTCRDRVTELQQRPLYWCPKHKHGAGPAASLTARRGWCTLSVRSV